MATNSENNNAFNEKHIKDNVCDNCQANEKTSAAVSFCYRCDAYLCNTCDSLHKKLATDHDVTYKLETSGYERRQTCVPCHLHSNESEKYYCEAHNSIFCNKCKINEHKTCYIEGLTKALSEVNILEEFNSSHLNLFKVKDLANKVYCEKELKLNTVCREIGEIRARIDLLRKQINTIFDNCHLQINKQEQTLINGLSVAKETCKEFKRHLKIQIKCMEGANANQSKMFLLLNDSNRMCKMYTEVLEEIQDIQINCEIKLNSYEGLKKLVENTHSLGNQDVVESEEFLEKESGNDEICDGHRTKSSSNIKSRSPVKEVKKREPTIETVSYEKKPVIEDIEGPFSNKEPCFPIKTVDVRNRIDEAEFHEEEYMEVVEKPRKCSCSSIEPCSLAKEFNAFVRSDEKEFPEKQSGIEAGEELGTKLFSNIVSCSPIKDVSVRVRVDEKVPVVTGCKWLPDGQILLCDNSNRNIKILDKDLNITFTTPCSSAPFDIDLIDFSSGVVTLPDAKSLQFVTVKPGFRFKHTKYLKLRCFGVVTHGKSIFVCIDDLQQSAKCVIILTLEGDKVSYISHTGSGSPRYLCTNGNGSRIYYTGGIDKDMFINCVTKDGFGIFSVSSIELHSPRNVLSDDDGTIIVADDGAKHLQIISSDGVLGKKIMLDKEGLSEPRSLVFDTRKDFLIVFFLESNLVRSKVVLYKLKYSNGGQKVLA